MMAAPFGPLMSLMFSTIVVLAMVSFSRPLTFFVTILSCVGAAVLLAYRSRRFPRWIMDVLDRLTNKAALEREHEARARAVVAIDAARLADRVKERVVGQDRVVDSIAAQLRRRLAGRRPDKPVAVFCLAGPPGVGKTHLAKVLSEESVRRSE